MYPALGMDLTRSVSRAKPLSGGRTFPPSPLPRWAPPFSPGSASNPKSKNDPQADLNGGRLDSIGGRAVLKEDQLSLLTHPSSQIHIDYRLYARFDRIRRGEDEKQRGAG